MSNLVDVKVPDIGGSSAVPVIEVLVKDGDRIEAEGVLLVMESDKATMEIPSPAAGTVRGMKVAVGAKLSMGDVICQLEVGEAKAEAPAAAAPAPAAPAKASAPPVAAAAPAPAAQAAPPATAGGGSIAVTIPDIGDFKDIPVIELLVAEGASVAKDATMLVLESDKSTMEVPAPADGVVRGLKLKVGDRVSKGSVVCTLEGAGGGASPPSPASGRGTEGEGAAALAAAVPQHPATPAAAAPLPLSPTVVGLLQTGLGQSSAEPTTPLAGEGPKTGSTAHAGPAARKFARELGVEIGQVTGSGVHGRVVVEDIQAFVKLRMSVGGGGNAPAAAAAGGGIPPIPAQDFSAFGPIETKPLARIRKLSAAHLSRAWLNIPHVTQNEEADITELEAFRKSVNAEGVHKLTLLPFLMKAVAAAMKEFPEFNSSLAPAGDALILKGYCNLGFAADTDAGLVVPVVKGVWDKGIVQLGKECGELAKKARDAKLKPDEMRGGCMSISSLGGLGVSGHFTPIVNAPEVAILGVSKASLKPVWDGKTFAPRLMLPLSLSYDHRVIDGAYAARFTVALAKLLADVRRLVL